MQRERDETRRMGAGWWGLGKNLKDGTGRQCGGFLCACRSAEQRGIRRPYLQTALQTWCDSGPGTAMLFGSIAAARSR